MKKKKNVFTNALKINLLKTFNKEFVLKNVLKGIISVNLKMFVENVMKTAKNAQDLMKLSVYNVKAYNFMIF